MTTSKVVHVRWLHVNNIETLITDLKIPQVYSKVIRRKKSFTIAAQRFKPDYLLGAYTISSL